jgi:hypothetical protein
MHNASDTSQTTIPINCIPISGKSQAEYFTTSRYVQSILSPAIILEQFQFLEQFQELKNVNQSIQQNKLSEDTATAIWEGRAIMMHMGGMDGLAQDYIAA